MQRHHLVSSLIRLAVTAALISVAAGVASAQTPPASGKGYEDPEGVPVRPPVIDVEPVWARPAIDTLASASAARSGWAWPTTPRS